MKPILVVGDLIIDAYHYGRLGGTAPDFPTILAHQESTKLFYGGAGLVVANMLAHERPVVFVTLVGTGRYASYADAFEHTKLTKVFLCDTTRPTTVKERFWVDGHKLLEWHHFESTPLSATRERELLQRIKKEIPKVDKVLIADYRHGLLSQRAAATIIELSKKAKVPVYVDSQVVHARGNLHWYKGATLFFLNTKEAVEVDPQFSRKRIRESLLRLQKILECKNVVVKLDAEGSAAMLGKKFIRTRVHPVQMVDPVGAGDAFAAALAIGNWPPTARDFERANLWAALSVTKIGTQTPTLKEYEAFLENPPSLTK